MTESPEHPRYRLADFGERIAHLEGRMGAMEHKLDENNNAVQQWLQNIEGKLDRLIEQHQRREGAKQVFSGIASVFWRSLNIIIAGAVALIAWWQFQTHK